MIRICAALAGACLVLAACDRGPAESDMAGCAVSSRAITHRDVAECAVERESIRREKSHAEKQRQCRWSEVRQPGQWEEVCHD